MAELGVHPPAEEAQHLMGSLPGARFTPGVTFAVDGPAPAGPEAAGAILILQNTLAGEEAAQSFWSDAAMTLREAMDSPGFVRFIGFADGLCNYALGFWRSLEDAQAFARSHAHEAAVRELSRSGNQYSHFAGLYRMENAGHRHFHCDSCGTRTAAPAESCSACGGPLTDVFRSYVRPAPAGEAVR